MSTTEGKTKLFNVIEYEPNGEVGTVSVQCPDCGTIFVENDTEDSVAGCPDCDSMGYVFDEN